MATNRQKLIDELLCFGRPTENARAPKLRPTPSAAGDWKEHQPAAMQLPAHIDARAEEGPASDLPGPEGTC